MNQTCKISIVRGACRFATPLHLGGDYVLSFEGERANEADSVLVCKCRSTDPHDTAGIGGLAVTTVIEGRLHLKMNKQVLLDYFKECGQCDVDGEIDAHAYVLNSEGVIIADSDITVEYSPIDFGIDSQEIAQISGLQERSDALAGTVSTHGEKIGALQEDIIRLDEQDAQNLIAAARDATEKANGTLELAKAYADAIKNMIAKMQYVKCDDESTPEKEVYHRLFIKKNEHGAHTLAIDETQKSIDGGDPETSRYVYIDTMQTITGNKTFSGNVIVVTQGVADNSTKAANTAWVVAKLANWWGTMLASVNSWSGKQTFSGGIEGNLTGNVTGSVTGNVTGNVDATTLDVTDAETHTGSEAHAGAETHTGSEAHAGAETHTGSEAHSGEERHDGLTVLSNVVEPVVGFDAASLADKSGINQKFLWDAIAFLAPYLDGSFRIGTDAEPVFDAAEWRTHDNQVGYVNWVATSVGSRCFFGKTTLRKVRFPNVETVKNSAFEGCTNLTDVKFDVCKKIEPRGFWNCDEIYTISSDRFPLLERIENNAFNDAGGLNWIELPRCKLVDEDAFKSIGAVTNVELGSEVTDDELGDPAVIDAVLDRLPLNEAVATAYSTLLTLVPNLKDTHTVFDGYIYDKNALTKFHAPKMQVLGDFAVHSPQTLSDVNLEKVLFIGGEAMSQIKYNSALPASIQYLKIPECRYIGYQAFGSLTNSYWVYPVAAIRADSLKYVCREAFYMARGLTQFYAPHLKRVADRAFWGCLELVGSSYTEDGVTVGDTNMVRFDECTHVGERGFSGRGSAMALTKISLNACEHIGNGAFEQCSNLTDVYLYSMNGNQLVQAPSSESTVDASIDNWGLPTTAYSGATESHTGVAVHCVNDAGRHIIVGYQGGWRVIGLE